jgi:cation transport regulator ChaC
VSHVQAQDAHWYFGYGSNMHPAIFLDRRQMHPLLTRTARLENYNLCFNLPIGPGERGVANIEPESGARTCGVLYLLTPEELGRLDRTEGVHFGAYHRIRVAVLVEDGARVPAFTYRASVTREGRKPSARYLRLLVEGARLHGLPRDYVQFLASFELAWDEREGGSDHDRPKL